MFHDTRPAELDTSGGEDRWAPFRISHPQERLALLRQLRDGQVPVILNGPDGATMTSTLWAVDEKQPRLSFTIDPGMPVVSRLVEADEAVAVAYMDSVKLQFDLHHIVAVHGAQASTLQCALPQSIFGCALGIRRLRRTWTHRVEARVTRVLPQLLLQLPTPTKES